MMDMSQKTRIIKVRHSGAAVFLGHDAYGNPQWTRNPEKIMDWLCDGWRYRFNQHREHRKTRRLMEDVDTHERMWVNVPLGGADVKEPIKDSQARLDCPWLACIPSPILASCARVENTEWFAALKRRKTSGGRTPRFRSRHANPQWFVCWRNQSKTGNAIYHQTSRKRGVVVITGSVPASFRKHSDTSARWRLTVHIRVSRPIRAYTSVAVNWTTRSLVFVNEPQPISRQVTGRTAGIDRGVKHTLALSDGTMLDMPQPTEHERVEYRRLQRKLARQDRTNEKQCGKKAKFSSHARRETLNRMERLRGRINRRKDDWVDKTTTTLIRDFDLIAVEALQVANMTARPKAQPDPNHPQRWLKNGATAKAGLNRSILANRWSMLRDKLAYKAKLAGVQFFETNSAYTSQACSQCGHVAKESRESQAVFHCVNCGFKTNADTNAARNILDRALNTTGTDGAEGAEGHNILRNIRSLRKPRRNINPCNTR